MAVTFTYFYLLLTKANFIRGNINLEKGNKNVCNTSCNLVLSGEVLSKIPATSNTVCEMST